MGKPTGFLEYNRQGVPYRDVAQRICDHEELYAAIDPVQRKEQAARCMNCGAPFCQSAMELEGKVTGCPLHNLIPEFNDELYHGHLQAALDRLLKTNPFPEFTGRVCPALCEKACICGMNDESVSIHDNERFLIETGFEKGWIQPKIVLNEKKKKVAVIGSGPSGLSVATTLCHRGYEVHVYEREEKAGGLLMFGIPNMKLDKQIVDRRIHLMEQEGVVFHLNTEIGKDVSIKDLEKEYGAVAICVGAKKARDLNAGGRDGSGIYFAVDYLSQATRHFVMDQDLDMNLDAKNKRVVVVGGGDTGNDCVATCIRQGCKSVIQLEMTPCPSKTRLESNPWPQWPMVYKVDYGQEECQYVFGSDPRIYQTTIKRFLRENGELKAVETIKLERKEGRFVEIEGSEKIVEADLVLIAAGFVGCEDEIIKDGDLPTTARNTILPGKDGYKLENRNLFVAGDALRGPSLVVWGIAQGKECARAIDQYLMGYSNIE